jgi:hypothetical protein
VERSASGVDVSLSGSAGAVGAFIDEATDDGSGIVFRTHAFLRCKDVTGAEIVEFMEAPIARRRRLYISWKRREVESRLGFDRAICGRCSVAFKVHENEWNGAGFCSKTCHGTHLKSGNRPSIKPCG